MRQRNRLVLAAWIAIVLLHGSAVAKEYSKPPTELVSWPLPWARGVSLDYTQSSESLVEKKGVGNVISSEGVVRVRIERGDANGFVQKWTTLEANTKYEKINDAGLLYMQETGARLRDMPVEVQLSADGSYAGILNMDYLHANATAGMKPRLQQAFGNPESPGLRSGLGNIAELLTSPELVEMRISVLPTMYNFAARGGLGLDYEYTYQDQGPNLVGGEPFPMTGRITLRKDELQPGWMMLEWAVGIDREKGGRILADASRKMLGEAFIAEAGTATEAAILDMAHNIDIGNSTRFRIDAQTGIVQWMQTVQRKRVGDYNEVSTITLTLRQDAYTAGTAAVHAALAGEVQDCVDARADTALVIRACTSLLESSAVGKPLRAVAYFNRGRAHAGRDELDEALSDLDHCVRLAPEQAAAHGMLGSLQGRRGELDAAIVSFDRAIALDPARADSWVNRGTANEAKGEYRLAIEDYSRAVQVSPDAALGWGGRCWSRAVSMTELEAALQDCDRAIALDARDANHLNSRGFVNFRLGRLDASIRDYDAAIAAQPQVASSFYVRGLAKKRQGDAKGSRQDHLQALALDPGIMARYVKYGVQP